MYLVDIGNHASGVTQGVLFAHVVVDQLLVLGVVEGGPQVSGREELAFPDFGGLLHVLPLTCIAHNSSSMTVTTCFKPFPSAIIVKLGLTVPKLTIVHQEELVGAREALDGNHIRGSWAIDTHGGCSLVTAIDTGELVTRPDTEDGAHREVGVHNAGAIQGVEGNTESLASHVLEDGLLLRASVLAHMRVAQSLEEELVGEHVDGELLVAEGVDAGSGTAGSSADLEGDGAESLPHAHQQPGQALVGGGLAQKQFQAVTELRSCERLPGGG